MQLSGDTALATAVDADVRMVIYKVEADWNQNGLYNHALSDLTDVVKSVSVDRDITSTLPQEVTLVEGFMAAQMTLRLGGVRSGDTKSIAELLSPWRADSPLYGIGRMAVPIRAYMGMQKADGTLTYIQQFQGKISTSKVTASNREISLVCLDGSEDLRAEINLPQLALPPGSISFAAVNMRMRINSQWVIDYVLRKNGIHTSPPPHEKVFYCATMHGSVIPELGHSTEYWMGEGVLTDEVPIYQPGRPGWGLAYGGMSSFYFLTKSRGESNFFTAQAGQTLCIQVQADLSKAPMQHPGSQGLLALYSSGNSYLVGCSIGLTAEPNGRLVCNVWNGITLVQSIGGPTLGTAGWTDCWVEVELGSPLSNSAIRFPGTSVTGVNLSGIGASPTLSLYPHVTTFGSIPIQDLHISNRTGLALGATRYNPGTWTPEADIDPGLNEFTGMPLRRGSKSWDLLKEVVAAELGVIGFSEAGRPFFKNRDTLRRQNLTVEKTLDSSKVLTELGLSEQAAAVRNVVTATVSARMMTGPSDSGTAWRTVYSLQNPNEMLIGPGITTIDVTLDSEGALADPYVAPTLYTTAAWDALTQTEQTHGFAATTMGGVQISSGISLTIVPLSPLVAPDRVRLLFNNTSGSSFVKLQTTSGQAAFKIRGREMYQADPVRIALRRTSSITKYGERVYEFPTSDWLQLEQYVSVLALSLLKDLKVPVPVVDRLEAVGDPRLQLQDTVQLEDLNGLGGPSYAGVVGCSRTLDTSSGRLIDSLSVRPFAAPGKWILGHSVWSVLGSTTKL